MRSLVFLVLGVFLFGMVSGDEYYMANNPSSGNADWGDGLNSNSGLSKETPFLTAQYAWSQMDSGDILIIDDGVYGQDSCKGKFDYIPEGNPVDGYTVIRAENEGRVVIDGEGSSSTMKISGDDIVDGSVGEIRSHDYIEIRGIIFNNSASHGIELANVNHVKIINCGVVGTVDGGGYGIRIAFSNETLIEGSYVWGGEGRYRIATFHSDHSIIRNCVVRVDKSMDTDNALGAYAIYGSTNIEVQNCIGIDSDSPVFWDDIGNVAGVFGAPTSYPATQNSGPINFTNVISINNHMRFGSHDWNAYPAQANFKDCIGWDHRTIRSNDFIHSQGNSDLNHCTFGEVDTQFSEDVAYSYFNGWKGGNSDSVKNSIWYNFANGGLFYDIEESTYNNVYRLNDGNIDVSGTSSLNTVSIDPFENSLKYLTRIESGSDLDSVGEGGTYVGANVLKMHGKPGSMWGEDGFNKLQDGTGGQEDISLWPFPNEDVIKERFASYYYTNGTHELLGDRGFAAEGNGLYGGPVTLTSYIWEYLGNPCPEEICGAEVVCEVNWSCSNWAECSGGFENRSCIDLGGCLSTYNEVRGCGVVECHEADLSEPCDGVDTNELRAYLERWTRGEVLIGDVLGAVGTWSR
jgi:hypothetical protein